MQVPIKIARLSVTSVICAVLFMAALTYTTPQVLAAEVPHALTFNVSTGGFKFSGQDDLRQEPVFDVRLGYDIIGNNISDSIGIEGGLSYVSTFSNKDNTPVNAYLMRVDATYPFTPRKRVVPFLAVGAGAMIIDRADKTESSPLLAYGGGVKYFVQEFLAMRLDVRQNILFEVGSRNEFQYMFGLSFLLDRDKKIRRLPLPPPPPVAKKGPAAPAVPVIDFDEPEEPTKNEPEKAAEPQKAAEPEKAAEGPAQVPLPVAVIAAPVAAVTGLLSPPEQPKVEPEQPKVEPVQPKIEPKRVVAEPPPPAKPEPARAAPQMPQPAPQTPEPAPRKPEPVRIELINPPATPVVPAVSQVEMVESILCPMDPPAGRKPRVLKQPSATVLFDSGSAAVKPRYIPEIDRIASYLKKHPGSEVYIEGHTDRKGRPEYNMELSKKRVESVKRALSRRIGKVEVRVTGKGFGCRIPVETNRAAKGRQKNRRATIEVTRP